MADKFKLGDTVAWNGGKYYLGYVGDKCVIVDNFGHDQFAPKGEVKLDRKGHSGFFSSGAVEKKVLKRFGNISRGARSATREDRGGDEDGGNRTASALKATASAVGQAGLNAAETAAARAATQFLVNLARTSLGEHYPAALNTPAGEAIASIAIPAIAFFGFTALQDKIPHGDKLVKVAEMALQGGTNDAAREVQRMVGPVLAQLAANGTLAGLLGGGQVPMVDPLAIAPPKVKKAPVARPKTETIVEPEVEEGAPA